MTSIKNIVRAGVLGIAMIGATLAPTKEAKADGGAVVAGVAGGLILGSIIGSAAHANHGYYYGQPSYYAPAPRYYAPAYSYGYGPTFGFSYSSGNYYGGHRRHYRHRHYGHGGRHYRKHRRHHRHHRRHHRRHHW